jgi:hypothetical protein
MRAAGYADAGWRLVLASYAAPITGGWSRCRRCGCPYSKPDAQWGRTVPFPPSDTLRGWRPARRRVP